MAESISRIFNPLLNPVIAFAILIFSASRLGGAQQMGYFTIATVFSSATIYAYIYYLKHKRVIHSTEFIVREHRINPLTFGVLSYALGFFFLTLFNAPPIVRGLMFCYVTNTIVVLLITRRWKISIHTTAIANPLVAIVYQFGWMALPILGLVPLVGFARVKMGRHDVLQVAAGGLLGILMTALQLTFF
jgi:membrane-associated phospholipid phosphatase